MESRREKEEEKRKDHCVQQALKQEFMLCFQAACGWALKQTHNARGFFFFCFVFCFFEQARRRKSKRWKDGVKTVEERCRERSEEIRKQSCGVDERSQCWQQLEAQREEWKMENVHRMKSNRKTGIASGEPSMSQCGLVIGEEESAVHGQEKGGGETTEKYFRVLEMLLSLIRACCCETDWAESYSPQLPLVSFFSSPLLGSFIFLLPRPLLIRRGKDDAVWFGAWFNIRKGLYSASKQRALFFFYLHCMVSTLNPLSSILPTSKWKRFLKSELCFITSWIKALKGN